MTAKTLERWTWCDGDIGRRKVMEFRGENVVLDVAPKYVGRGAYTDDWYLEIWPMSFIDPENEGDYESLTAMPIKVEPKIRKNKNGDYAPIASDLDAKCEHILENLKVCTTCDRYFYVANPAPWQVSETNSFCDRSHHDMWEAANEN